MFRYNRHISIRANMNKLTDICCNICQIYFIISFILTYSTVICKKYFFIYWVEKSNRGFEYIQFQ